MNSDHKKSQEQLEIFKRFLKDSHLDLSSPVFTRVISWVRNFPRELNEGEKNELRELIKAAFSISDEQMMHALAGSPSLDAANKKEVEQAKELEEELLQLLPKNGFFRSYIEYTKHNEAPLAYHFFSSLLGVGSAISRNVWFDMGYYKVYPAMGVILLGPSGLKKTTASDIMVKILNELKLTNIYSEKLTPESLVNAMKEDARGLVYAPEGTVLLSRQRYMEGMIPLITRLMDCPDIWSSETITRNKTTLHNVAISVLLCSTPDWFVENTPEGTFGGGFMARNLLVIQEISPREEALPNPGQTVRRSSLCEELVRISRVCGEMRMSDSCMARYILWYHDHKERYRHPENEVLNAYYQRRPDHVKRVAMCIHVADHRDLELCLECFDRAVNIMDWSDKFIPPMLRQMFKNATGVEQDLVLRAIMSAGGLIDHASLLRKVQHRMDAKKLKSVIESLIEADQVIDRADRLQHCYVLKRPQ